MFENSSEDEIEEESRNNKKLLLPSHCSNSYNFLVLNSKSIKKMSGNVLKGRSSLNTTAFRNNLIVDNKQLGINKNVEKRTSFITPKLSKIFSTNTTNMIDTKNLPSNISLFNEENSGNLKKINLNLLI